MINKTSLYDTRWIDLVFHNRNKAYGAYVLRLEYAKNMMTGILASVGIFVLLFGLTFLPKKPAVVSDNYKDVLYVREIILPAKADVAQPVTVVRPSSKPIPKVVQKDVFIIKPDDALKNEQPPAKDPDPNAGNSSEGGNNNGSNNNGPATVSGGNEGGGSERFPFDDNKPVLIVEQMPEFPGGEAALLNYIKKNVEYSSIAKSNGEQGTVYVSFVVGRSGEVENVKVVRGIGRECDEAAIQVIKSLPKFSPGKQNGKTVRVQYNIPIKFTLSN